jgi:hypothetical protein
MLGRVEIFVFFAFSTLSVAVSLFLPFFVFVVFIKSSSKIIFLYRINWLPFFCFDRLMGVINFIVFEFFFIDGRAESSFQGVALTTSAHLIQRVLVLGVDFGEWVFFLDDHL